MKLLTIIEKGATVKKLMTMAEIRANGGEAAFSEHARYTIIHVETGNRRYTGRKPSLSYYSPLMAWDNERNEEVPKRPRIAKEVHP